MDMENRDTTIADLHRIRRQIASKFGGDVFAINADAQARSEASGRRIIQRRPSPNKALDRSGRSGGKHVDG